MTQKSLLLDLPEKPTRETLAGQMAVMLERLKEGPLRTKATEDVTHRGQAVIHAMRRCGHRIDTVKVDGHPSYVWRSFDDTLVEVTPALQELYYRTPHWRAIAAQRRAFDGHRCCQCSEPIGLDVHHWRYKLFYEEMRTDLMTLCRDCHEAMHTLISGSKIHFPRYLHKDLVARIQQEARP